MFPLKKTFSSLYRARLFPLLLLCALLAVVLVGLLVAGITSLSICLVDFKWAWVNTLISTVVGIALGIGGWFMLPVMTVLVGGFFQDTVIRRVEAAFYPDSGGPVGIEAIAATLQEETDTLVDVVEPYLLKMGLLIRTSSGRKTPAAAYDHLDIPRQTLF